MIRNTEAREKCEMNNGSLLVTVITPSFNQGEFIEDTIKSVVNQTHPNIEYIIIDNESTDNTDEIVKKYMDKYAIKYIREKDRGQSDAINKGLDLAKGEIVCWLNSDDMFYDENVLSKVVQVFEKDKELKVVFGGGYWANKQGNELDPFPIAERLINLKSLNFLYPILQPSTFWRRNDTRLNQNYHYIMDWDFFRRFLLSNYKYCFIKDALSIFRVHGQCKTNIDSYHRRAEIYRYVKKNLGRFNAATMFLFFEYVMFRLSDMTRAVFF